MFKVTKRALTTAAVVAAASAPSSAYASPVVRPNADEQILTTQAIPTASGPTGSPAVRPNPDEQTATDATTRGGPGSEVIDNGGYGPAVVRSVVVPVARPKGGFDWGDAGIGAAAAIGLAMLGVAGAFALSQRRARRSGRSTALIS
jgi:hypothetical protein